MSNSFQFKGNVEENLIPRDELATQPNSIKKKKKKAVVSAEMTWKHLPSSVL